MNAALPRPKIDTVAAGRPPAFVRSTLTTVFVALLIDILAFTIILPLYPRILEHYEKVDGGNETSLYYRMRSYIQLFRGLLGVSGARFDIVLFGGALGSLFSFLQFVSSPVIGSLSDRFGRRTVLLASMLGNALSMLLWIFSESFGVFVCSRIVGGLTEGNVQMSIAVISDITTAQTRSKGLALVGIAFSLGFTVGPPLGAYFTSVDLTKVFPLLAGLPINQYSSPALFAFVLIVIETLYLFVKLPETRGYKTAASSNTESLSGSSSPRRSARLAEKALGTGPDYDSATTPTTAPTVSLSAGASAPPPPHIASRIHILSLLHFLFLFFFSGMEFTLTFLTHDRFGFSHAHQGRFLAFIGILSACVQGGYTRRVAHKLVHERTIVAQGILAAGLGLLVLGNWAWSVGYLYLGAAFLAFTSGTVVTGLTALASYETVETSTTAQLQQQQRHITTEHEDVGTGNRGRVLGHFRSVGQLGRSLGPLFACTTYWVLGSRAAYSIAAAAMLLLAAGTYYLVPPTTKKGNSAHSQSGMRKKEL
ncbi:hypothetical protein PhCBS80983_g03269 [Powellomyces hirtus]|uniref:Major facilitator superfamily (MFS) profile domain-containing protein n=1 Tax=Powellomyces hirtus TaxID=109895 RepID=A0A507E312_9FUNG|nr:hypothetical protein PhCBS80983_g03269 [Powellomyces hirtus]